MKRLLIITNLLWATIFFIFVLRCCQSETKNCETISSNYAKVDSAYGRLTLNEAKGLSDDYFTKHYSLVNPSVMAQRIGMGNDNKDARTVWFSLETLKQFLWEIESRASGCNGCEKLNLGVRIYYGVYPAPLDSRDTSFASKQRYKHTVFMVPTYAKYNKIGQLVDYDFNPKYPTYQGKGSACNPITLEELKDLLQEKRTGFGNGSLKITEVQAGITIDEILADKFILSPHPKSLIKSSTYIAPPNKKEDDTNPPKDTTNPKGKGSTDKKDIKANLSLKYVHLMGGFSPKYGFISNRLFITSAYGQNQSEYMFQNHGMTCPNECEGVSLQ